MKKKMIAMILVIIMAAGMMSGCGGSSSPERVVERFFEALQAGDMEATKGYLDPSVQQKYDTGLSISNKILGLFGLDLDSDSIFSWIEKAADSEAFKDLSFKVTGSSKTDKSHAIVDVDVYVNGNKSTAVTIPCVKIDREWYIGV